MRWRGPARGGLWWVLLVLTASTLSSWAAMTSSPDGHLASWWPSAGLSIALLALTPLRWWTGLTAAIAGTCLVPHLVVGTSLPTAAVLTAGSALAALLGAWALRHARPVEQVRLSSPEDLGRLVIAAVASGTLMGPVGAVALQLDGHGGHEVWDALAVVGPTHVAWVLLFVGVLLPQQHARERSGRVETALQWTLLVAVLGTLALPGQPVAALALPLPFVLWGALRLGLRTTTAQLLLVGAGVSLCQVLTLGPFGTDPGAVAGPLDLGTVAQGYVVCIALMALPLALAMGHGSHLLRELRSERDLSEMTLATAGCLVLVSELDGTLLRVNQAATRLLGVEADTLLGTPAWNLVPREHRNRARAMFAAPDGSALPTSVEGRLVDHTGEERRVLWSTGVVRDEHGAATHLVLTGLDVTAELNAAGHTEHLLRAPIDTAIVGIDRQGRITLVNSGAETVLGRSSEQLVGTPFIRVLSAAELAEWARGFRVKPDFASLLAQAVDAAPRDWHWLGDGTSTLVSMELSRIIDNSGALIGYLCVANDVTETRTRQQLLVDALDKQQHVVDRLRELDATKDHFVTTVSHELRTPVATIVGYTEMLTAGDLGELNPQQVRAMDAVNRNGERLVTLVDNLLALAGVTGETIARERDRVDLVDVAKEAERQAGALLAGRRLTAIFDFPGQQVPVGGDRRQLGLIISNLLSNSIKFTEDGGEVRCTVSVDGDTAVLEVRDNGLGIPEEEQANLFGRFWRSSTAVSRHIQGTGLGLATVQAIVAAHGGTIQVRSAHLAGTAVTVALPLRVETTRQPGPRAERVRRERTGPLRPRRPGLPELSRRSGRGPA